jgi:hypothetical protein
MLNIKVILGLIVYKWPLIPEFLYFVIVLIIFFNQRNSCKCYNLRQFTFLMELPGVLVDNFPLNTSCIVEASFSFIISNKKSLRLTS